MRTPVARWRFVWPQRTFSIGLLVGAALTIGARIAINETPVADWIVRPLVRSDTGGTADAIVVLGAGVVDNCVPNGNALRRVLLGVRLYKQQRAPVLLFTGGVPKGRSCAVAEIMADLAYDLGVPRERVLVEADSHSTRENAEKSAPMLRGLGAQRVLLVTDRLHITRAVGAFARFGFTTLHAAVPVNQGHPDNVSMLTAAAREAVALSYYRLRGWLGANAISAQPGTASAALPGSR